MNDIKDIFAKNLSELRQASGMTQLELGERLNYSDKTVSKWERGESIPDAGMLKQIADVFGVSVDYLLEEISIAEGSLSKKAEFLTKYCNIKQNSSAAWLSTQDVERMCGAPLRLEDFAETYGIVGIDLSQTRDLTACTLIIERGGEFYVFAKFFLPSERIDECTERDGVPYNIYIQRGLLQPSGTNFVDYHDCFEFFRELVEKYRIFPLQVGYDRYSAQYLVKDMAAYGFHMDDVYQGENLTPVIHECDGLLRDRTLQLGSNNVLKAHFLNVGMKQNEETRKIRPVKIDQRCHIDGFVAVIDALTVRQKWYDQIGDRLKNIA